MTATERRWKWVKKDCLPEDLINLMVKLKIVTDDANEESTKRQQRPKAEAGATEEKMTLIKRDYLNDDFTLFPVCKEVIDLLKEERMKSKYSADYHAQVLN